MKNENTARVIEKLEKFEVVLQPTKRSFKRSDLILGKY